MMEALSSWQEEKRSAYIYRRLSQMEPNPIHQQMFLDLSDMAEQQSLIWETALVDAGIPIPHTFSLDYRTKMMMWLCQYVGTKNLRPILAAMKIRGMSIYNHTYHHSDPNTLPPEKQHHTVQHSGNIRAAIFGISDGLLSNASLIYGIVGANAGQHFIILSGIAGLLAGAFSMGAGEYVSVRSQRQMLEYQLALEKKELELYPQEEAAELALIYRARGLSQEDAEKISHILIKNPDKALETLAREELGLNPNELGSPWGAAISSFFSFAAGAAIPLLPFVVSSAAWNIKISIALTALTFFGVGAILSLFTERSVWWGGLRMVLMGTAIGCITYYIGSLLGVHSL